MGGRGVNLALGAVLLGAAGIVYAVHYNQNAERARMRKGPLRDVQRRKLKQASEQEENLTSTN